MWQQPNRTRGWRTLMKRATQPAKARLENQLRTKSCLNIADEKRRFRGDELDDTGNGGHREE